ncbi:hypothetical protein A306_00000251 [Columba livia]|uniref:Uncharacterized protein n=1 Tax=Columba livia TaxID=8932 RepID=A0A2I0LQE3_COLLI|nr:hypothetical protein A306_00000251 [Columba livia]
MTMRPSATGA